MYNFKELYEAFSVREAIELLDEHKDAKIIAGGSDVLIKIRAEEMEDATLVSIYGIDALRGISMTDDGTIRILPLTSFSDIAANDIIREHIPVLGEAVDMVGGPQIRNIGTIGGNICNGVTSADSAPTLFAYDAELEVTSASGVRTVPIREFYAGPGRVHLSHGELLTAISIKKESYSARYGNYIKYAMRAAMDIATLSCSVNIKLSANKRTFEKVRIAYGVASPTPVRALRAEATAEGLPVSEKSARQISAAALSDVNPRDSWRASKDFRIQLVRELCYRATAESVRRSGGEL